MTAAACAKAIPSVWENKYAPAPSCKPKPANENGTNANAVTNALTNVVVESTSKPPNPSAMNAIIHPLPLNTAPIKLNATLPAKKRTDVPESKTCRYAPAKRGPTAGTFGSNLPTCSERNATKKNNPNPTANIAAPTNPNTVPLTLPAKNATATAANNARPKKSEANTTPNALMVRPLSKPPARSFSTRLEYPARPGVKSLMSMAVMCLKNKSGVQRVLRAHAMRKLFETFMAR